LTGNPEQKEIHHKENREQDIIGYETREEGTGYTKRANDHPDDNRRNKYEPESSHIPYRISSPPEGKYQMKY
jgi:hypothetical protein